MNMTRVLSYFKRDWWLLAALLACVVLCLALGVSQDDAESEESRISRVLSAMAGAGQVEVALYYEASSPCGAVVVAEGADNIAVQLRLTTAMSALLGLDPSRVAVYPSEGGH